MILVSDAMITFVTIQACGTLITIVGLVLTYLKSQQAVDQSLVNTKKADGLHAVFNSRLTELVESKQREAHAQGVIAGGLAQVAMDDHRMTDQLTENALKAQAMLVAEAIKAQAILVETARQTAFETARQIASQLALKPPDTNAGDTSKHPMEPAKP